MAGEGEKEYCVHVCAAHNSTYRHGQYSLMCGLNYLIKAGLASHESSIYWSFYYPNFFVTNTGHGPSFIIIEENQAGWNQSRLTFHGGTLSLTRGENGIGGKIHPTWKSRKPNYKETTLETTRLVAPHKTYDLDWIKAMFQLKTHAATLIYILVNTWHQQPADTNISVYNYTTKIFTTPDFAALDTNNKTDQGTWSLTIPTSEGIDTLGVKAIPSELKDLRRFVVVNLTKDTNYQKPSLLNLNSSFSELTTHTVGRNLTLAHWDSDPNYTEISNTTMSITLTEAQIKTYE